MKKAFLHRERAFSATQESVIRSAKARNLLYTNSLPEPHESGVFAVGEPYARRDGSHEELRENNYA